jgi:hypothetical protein
MAMFLPECAVASFALIIFLATAGSDQLHAIGDTLWTGVSNQKVNVITGHYVIRYGQTEALLRFENSAEIRLPIAASELAEGQIPNLIKHHERSAAIERLELPSLHW